MKSTTDTITSGTLYIISTPIGNLEDITLRALRLLKEVDYICAEDTRVTGRLLAHYEIKKKMISYHSYNERQRIPRILQTLKEGQQVALVSDAGTPGISDPAHRLVQEAIREKIPVVPIPGPTAAIAALVASGLPTNRFVFEGFLPRKKGRQTRLKQICEENGTIIIYESAVRIQKTIEDIVKFCGNRYIVICRELTKHYEEFIRGYAEEILKNLSSRTLKGEIVLLVAGKDFKSSKDETEKLDE
ncbi:MAG: 16S rRNA (cytidine(1402)-2'-O)-methyltransferase [Calditrichaeota bacterium]|nr:MAG: 16S rRNA (cytidine(1402)-2'-O)-methyltransferase [Calditrichota bacterium]